MSNTHLQWKRHVNTLRYLYRELELVEEVVEAATPKFLKYYREFCRQHEVHPTQGPPGTDFKPLQAEPIEINELVTGSMNTEYYNDENGNWRPIETPREENNDNEIDKAFAKLFRNLAFYLHPDAFPPDLAPAQQKERVKLFQKALEALEEKHYFRLAIMAEKFGIDVPTMNDEQIDWLQPELAQVRAKLSQIQSTYNYQFSECKTDKERDNLLRSFLMQNFNIQV